MSKHTITVFEHQSLIVDGKGFTRQQLEKFQQYYKDGEKNKYFSLINNGIKFNQHVGVIQVGGLTIEVLPKIDKNNDEDKWRKILIYMLRVAGILKYNTSNASLKLKHNSILDLYFELFLQEVEYLLHSGLIKKYRKIEKNLNALKGRLLFSQHISANIIHKERFYTQSTTYDVQHNLHCILYKTLVLLKNINNKSSLQSTIGSLLLNFPEMPDIKVTENTFQKIQYNRKNEHYSKAIDIAKLLLLNYHPDIQGGKNDIIALMFDMNMLWERFVYKSLCKYNEYDLIIHAQCSKDFWKGNYTARLKPDIFIEKKDKKNIVLDTKWKVIFEQPSSDDLQQMYTYSHYFNADRVALVYPGKSENIEGRFYLNNGICNMIYVDIGEDNHQKNIANQVFEWIK